MDIVRFLLVAAATPAFLAAAATAGSGFISGTVQDDQGRPVANAVITLVNKVSGHTQSAHTDAKGRFSLFNVPFNDYHLEAMAPGLVTSHRNVAVHSNLPVQVALVLPATGAVVVVEEKADLLEGHASSHIDIDHTTIEEIPAVVQSRGMESIVLQTPGFIQDENGRFHFRGSHGQVMYVVDGVPVTDQVQATFSNSMDPSQVEGMEVITGGISAEFGGKPGAVINLTSKSGLGTPDGFEGTFDVGAARFRTYEEGFNVRGCTDKTGYFVTVAGSSSDRFLDPVNFQNLHNEGDTGRIFVRLDRILTDTDTLRLSVSGGTTSRDVANLASQEAAGMDQRVHNKDASVNAGWTHLLGAEASLETTVFYRHAGAALDPTTALALGFQEGGPDTPFWVWQNRSLDNQGASFTYQAKHGDDTLKAGLSYVRYPITEHFAFAVTDLAVAQLQTGTAIGPGDPLYAYTAPGGGGIFRFDDQLAPALASAYVQDDLKAGNWNLGLGLRLDSYRGPGYVKTELQPRLGASYALPGNATLLRVSYDHLLITPENENLGFSTSQAVWNLTGAAGTPVPRLMPELQDSYLVGVEHQLPGLLKITLDYWWKTSTNTADNDQFLNTGLLFPIAAWKGRFHGLDLRADLLEVGGFSAYLSAGTVRTIFYSPTVGGLTSSDPLINGPVGTPYLIDHDEKLTLQLGLHYRHDGFHAQVIGRYDSGLIAGDPTAPGIAGNPDFAFGIPFVHPSQDSLTGQVWRVNPRQVWNLSLGQDFRTGSKSTLDAGVDLLNAFNEVALYNFLSTFGGTHVIPPRTLAAHLKFKF